MAHLERIRCNQRIPDSIALNRLLDIEGMHTEGKHLIWMIQNDSDCAHRI